jgi:molecular chaperone DnaK (HSP70)
VLSTAGEPWLGGDDCDSEIAAALRGELRLGSGEGGAGCSDAELRQLARRLKEQLSVSRRAELPLPLPPPSLASPAAAPPASDAAAAAAAATATATATAAAIAPANATASTDASATATVTSATATVTRAQLEEWCAPLLVQMRDPVMRAAAQAQVPLQGMFDSRAGKEGMSQGGAEAMKRAARDAASRQSRPGLKGRRVQRVLLVGAASRTPTPTPTPTLTLTPTHPNPNPNPNPHPHLNPNPNPNPKQVGAASRMPAVAVMLYEMVGERPSTGGVQPELAVALGAATQAGILEGSVTQVDVFNVLEAALIRGIAQGADLTQRQKRGPTKKSKGKRKRR